MPLSKKNNRSDPECTFVHTAATALLGNFKISAQDS
jgi:hypothetical protein